MNYGVFFAICGMYLVGVVDLAIWLAMKERAALKPYTRLESAVFAFGVTGFAWWMSV